MKGLKEDVVLEVASSEPLGVKMGKWLTFEFWQQDITDEDVLHVPLLELISTVGIYGSTTLFGEP